MRDVILVVVGNRPDVATDPRHRSGFVAGGLEIVPRLCNSLICSLQDESLLRVHVESLTRRLLEELVVKDSSIVDRVAVPLLLLVTRLVGPIRGLHDEPVVGHEFPVLRFAIQHDLPVLSYILSPRDIASHANDSNVVVGYRWRHIWA
jgi:hypothetical protein